MTLIRVTQSLNDLERWIVGRVAEGAARLVLMAEEHDADVARLVPTKTWDVNDATFAPREVARYVQALADAVLTLGAPRAHFDLWSYAQGGRRARSKPSARVTVYGNASTATARVCSACARKDAHIAKLGKSLKTMEGYLDESYARAGRLREMLQEQREELRAADARSSPFAFTRPRKPLVN